MPTALRMARQVRGWTHSQLRERLRREAAQLGERLPGEWSLHRMVVRWEQGDLRPSIFYRRLFTTVYDVAPDMLGFTDDGDASPDAVTLDAATALLYAAPLTTDQVAAQPGHRLSLYVAAALADPSCPDVTALTAGLSRARQSGPQWLDRRRLAVCEQAGRRAVCDNRPTPPPAGTGPVPDWLAAGRLLGARLAAAVFTT